MGPHAEDYYNTSSISLFNNSLNKYFVNESVQLPQVREIEVRVEINPKPIPNINQ